MFEANRPSSRAGSAQDQCHAGQAAADCSHVFDYDDRLSLVAKVLEEDEGNRRDSKTLRPRVAVRSPRAFRWGLPQEFLACAIQVLSRAHGSRFPSSIPFARLAHGDSAY